MLHTICRLLLHLGKHIPYDFGVIACDLAVGVPIAGADDGHKAELRPSEGVVKVVFQEVVLRKVCDVASLDGGKKVDVGGV